MVITPSPSMGPTTSLASLRAGEGKKIVTVSARMIAGARCAASPADPVKLSNAEAALAALLVRVGDDKLEALGGVDGRVAVGLDGRVLGKEALDKGRRQDAVKPMRCVRHLLVATGDDGEECQQL
jgi:hypothetical protein